MLSIKLWLFFFKKLAISCWTGFFFRERCFFIQNFFESFAKLFPWLFIFDDFFIFSIHVLISDSLRLFYFICANMNRLISHFRWLLEIFFGIFWIFCLFFVFKTNWLIKCSALWTSFLNRFVLSFWYIPFRFICSHHHLIKFITDVYHLLKSKFIKYSNWHPKSMLYRIVINQIW